MLELPGYARRGGCRHRPVEGRLEALSLAGETADEVPVTVWSPLGLADDEPAPLLLVHDGAEYDQLAAHHDLQRRPRRERRSCRRTGSRSRTR